MHPQSPPSSQASAHAVTDPSVGNWTGGLLERCAMHPDKVALASGGRETTYGGLADESRRIAGMLRRAGFGRGSLVGAGFHRSRELIAGLWGILRCGAAYVPIDPGYPAARILQMTGSAGLDGVLTTRGLAGAFAGTRVLAVEDAAGADDFQDAAIDGADPVYAIFTSGSTGVPKAASVFHSGFANLLSWYRTELALGPDDRALVISSPSFDLTQKNLFTPLLVGGMLALDDCATYDIPRILGLIRGHRVTWINCTPSAFYPLVDAAAAEGFRALESLRFAVLGGEPISIPRLRAWLEHPACGAEVVNSYGPTECTDICLFHRLHRGNLDEFPFVPLGREIPGAEVTIRGDDLEILPDGETGELCISGAGVGGGYLRDPQRTAERFIGGVYRTGDLARRLPGGVFEFRGRADHQVKVNGFRIELGEIELAINDHESVKEAVVTAGNGKLTAHVQGGATAAQLRAHLAARLPSYMIPAEFVFVEAFPLTPNGKVDRKALTSGQAAVNPAGAAAAASDLEARILALWSEVLGRPLRDPEANFFDLGGTSIHLAVLHVRLREMTGTDFPITDLFAHPSALALAGRFTSAPEAARPDSAAERARLARNALNRFQRPTRP